MTSIEISRKFYYKTLTHAKPARNLQAKVDGWLRVYRESGGRQSINAVLRANPALQNPVIGERVRDYLGVEKGSLSGMYMAHHQV